MQLQLFAAAVTLELAVANCVGEGTCDVDGISALQTFKAGGKTLAEADQTSPMTRLSVALRDAPQDAATICMEVKPGDTAPIQGTFSSDSKKSMVKKGFVAPSRGTFCAPRGAMVLLQRSHAGFNELAHHVGAETVLTAKNGTQNPWGADGVFEGKLFTNRTECEELPLECKISVFPLRKVICPILWSLPNSVLKMLPGCEGGEGEGRKLREHIEAACERDLKLQYTCPLTCDNVVDYVEVMEPSFKREFACWADVHSNLTCQTATVADKINEFIENQVEEMIETLPESIKSLANRSSDWLLGEMPCNGAALETLCEPHCPLNCNMVMNVDMEGQSAQDECQTWCDGGEMTPWADVADGINDQFTGAINDVLRPMIGFEEDLAVQPCTDATAKDVCQSVCV